MSAVPAAALTCYLFVQHSQTMHIMHDAHTGHTKPNRAEHKLQQSLGACVYARMHALWDMA